MVSALLALAVQSSMALRIGGPGIDLVWALDVGKDGSIYAGGVFEGTTDFDPGPEVVEKTAKGDTDSFIAKYTPDGKLLKVFAFGGPDSDDMSALAVGPDGNLVVVGSGGAFDLGPHAFKPDQQGDGFAFGLTGDLEPTWLTPFSEEGYQDATEVAVAPDGSILVAGSTLKKFSEVAGETDPSGGWNAFVAKLDKTGRQEWLRTYGGESKDELQSLTLGPDGRWYAAGTFQETATFGNFKLQSRKHADIFVVEGDSTGVVKWAKGFGGESFDEVAGISFASGKSSSLVLTGSFGDSLAFGSTTLRSKGRGDAFFAKLDAADGNPLWARSVGGAEIDEVLSSSLTPTGDILVTGHFNGRVDFANTGTTFHDSLTPNGDVFLAKYSPAGDFRWSRSYGSKSPPVDTESRGMAVVSDSKGHVIAGGQFAGSVPFLAGFRLNSDAADGFVLRLDPDGQ